jgi:hypothetical protein
VNLEVANRHVMLHGHVVDRHYRSGLFRKDRRRGSGRLREAVEIVRKLQDRFPCAGMVNCSPPPALARRGRTILFRRRPHRRREAWPPEVGFAVDSPLEGDGFEPSVPGITDDGFETPRS